MPTAAQTISNGCSTGLVAVVWVGVPLQRGGLAVDFLDISPGCLKQGVADAESAAILRERVRIVVGRLAAPYVCAEIKASCDQCARLQYEITQMRLEMRDRYSLTDVMYLPQFCEKAHLLHVTFFAVNAADYREPADGSFCHAEEVLCSDTGVFTRTPVGPAGNPYGHTDGHDGAKGLHPRRHGGVSKYMQDRSQAKHYVEQGQSRESRNCPYDHPVESLKLPAHCLGLIRHTVPSESLIFLPLCVAKVMIASSYAPVLALARASRGVGRPAQSAP